MICQKCGKRQAVFQTHQLIDGRPSIIYLCEVCADEVRSGGKKSSTLNQYGRDITELAEQEKLDPVIGRNSEIDRVIHVLSRRRKNNPVLIGEPGVGKTAIAEGLAQRIVSGAVPETLQGKRIIALDLALMLAGASHRGEFEERLKKAISEVVKAKGEIILFIDELHTIVGAGAAQGAIDASNMLKPPLARGELQCIGATTLDEYRKHVEKDGALERRFQPVRVEEPTPEETLEILKGLRPHYENHHRVRVSDDALKMAVELSSRYISDRFQPDKAIDILDEASAKKRLDSIVSQPPKLVKISKELKDLRSKPRKTLAEMERIEELSSTLGKETQDTSSDLESIPEVTDSDIAKIVASITGIQVEDLSEDERERLGKLEKRLHERIVGQDDAVFAVSSAIRRARAGLKDPNRPIGSFIFLGPTGVGKTELAKALAEALYGDEELMVRLDMSEYSERHTVSRMIGSPPGYVGYDEAGQLTEAVRRKPFSVILLDEVEKAHPDVFNILLQILEDGRLTDSHGKTVDFKNTILIMTSNVGTSDISQVGVGFGSDAKSQRDFEELKDNLLSQLQKRFRPEFLNRIDEVVVFHPLTKDQVRKIADILIGKSKELLASQGMKLNVSRKVSGFLAKKGFDPDLGARPLRRLIQKEIENPVSNGIVSGDYSEGDTVIVDFVSGKLVFKVKKGARIKV